MFSKDILCKPEHKVHKVCESGCMSALNKTPIKLSHSALNKGKRQEELRLTVNVQYKRLLNISLLNLETCLSMLDE